MKRIRFFRHMPPSRASRVLGNRTLGQAGFMRRSESFSSTTGPRISTAVLRLQLAGYEVDEAASGAEGLEGSAPEAL